MGMSGVTLSFICILVLAGLQATSALSLSNSTHARDTVEAKLDRMDKMAKAVSWHKNSSDVPAHVKAAVKKDRQTRNFTKGGSCIQQLAKEMKTQKKAAFLAKQPEHAGANSYAKPGVGSTQVMANTEHGTVDGQAPFDKVLKDGYFEVGCYNDFMLHYGDKFGSDKDKYVAKPSEASHANVAIAKYDELVEKTARQAMTPRVCYEFCRGLKGMVFFGIANGNECYCEPYFNPDPLDNSGCDVPCQGETTAMCGNAKGKSSIFEMHLCADTAEDLAENTVAAEEALTFFHESAALAVELGDKMTKAGDALEEVAGLSGLKEATADFGRNAMEAGGQLTKVFMKGRPVYEALLAAGEDARSLESGDFTVAATVTSAERAVVAIKSTEAKVRSEAKEVYNLVKLAYPAVGDKVFGEEPGSDQLARDLKSEVAANDFRLATYAMGETSMQPQGTTCSGDVIGMPMIGLGANGCGITCEHTVSPAKCVAFQHYQVEGSEDLCYMFSDVKDVASFEEPAGGAALVQSKKAPISIKASAVCKVKMSEIATGFKPKGTHKKNLHCFGACSEWSARDSVEAYSVPATVTVNGKEVIGKLA